MTAGRTNQLPGADHERGFIEAFIQRGHRARWLTLLDMGKRERLRARLAHQAEGEIDASVIVPLHGNAQYQDRIARLLQRLSPTRTCWCWSGNGVIDGKELDLAHALEAVVAWGAGTILSVEPGALAYFEPEDGEDRRWILVKDPKRRERMIEYVAAEAAERGTT